MTTVTPAVVVVPLVAVNTSRPAVKTSVSTHGDSIEDDVSQVQNPVSDCGRFFVTTAAWRDDTWANHTPEPSWRQQGWDWLTNPQPRKPGQDRSVVIVEGNGRRRVPHGAADRCFFRTQAPMISPKPAAVAFIEDE